MLTRVPAAKVRVRDLFACSEPLESRRLLAATTLRIVSYNVEADVDGVTAPRAGMSTVLAGIGDYAISGSARPIDVLALQETTSNTQTVQPIVTSLNAIYGAGTYAMSSLQLSLSSGTGNGPSALIYNTKTVTLLQSYAVPGKTDGSSGVYRQIGRYEMEPSGGTPASAFYFYVEHAKSGTGTTNAAKRQQEAAIVRQNEATLPADARVIYSGDFNTNTNGEGVFTTLMASGQGAAYDPRLPNGGVGNVDQSVTGLTESGDDLHYRDDYQFVTSNMLNTGGGVEIVPGSEQAFGNNGSVVKYGSVTDASNTALPGLANRSAVLSALTTASDHLPVVADYTDNFVTTGTIGGTVTTAGGAAVGGATVYLDLNGNGTLDGGDLSTTTDSGGAYAFSGVLVGSYAVRQVVPNGYTQASPGGGGAVTVNAVAGQAARADFVDTLPATNVTVTGVAVNGDLPALVGVQRSMVDDVVYTFDAPVIAGGGAFTIAVSAGRTGTVPTLNWTAVDPVAGGASTQWAVGFGGAGVQGGSIADGVYDLTMNPAAVTSATPANAVVQARPADTVYRLAGDVTGDGAVTIGDFNALAQSFGLSRGQAGYNAATDTDGDGAVTIADFNALAGRFGRSVFSTLPMTAATMPALGPASISGVVYKDNDADGQFDAGDRRRAGVVVFIDSNGDGRLDDGERQTITDARGRYTFRNLTAGSYRVRAVGQATPAATVRLTAGRAARNVLLAVPKA